MHGGKHKRQPFVNISKRRKRHSDTRLAFRHYLFFVTIGPSLISIEQQDGAVRWDYAVMSCNLEYDQTMKAHGWMHNQSNKFTSLFLQV